jgi:hypothetical protein
VNEDLQLQSSIVFPNPANDYAFVQSKRGFAQSTTMNIVDIIGNRHDIRFELLDDSKARIDISALPLGSYVLLIQSDDIEEQFNLLIR